MVGLLDVPTLLHDLLVGVIYGSYSNYKPYPLII